MQPNSLDSMTMTRNVRLQLKIPTLILAPKLASQKCLAGIDNGHLESWRAGHSQDSYVVSKFVTSPAAI
eukprot:scaffold76373_cov65-Cyclotella_meneghiniana.AAC.1